jgi:filamentous hemagglutinin family protein
MKSHAALNRVYRLVWSQINQCWVAVAETAKGQGKKAVRRKVDDGSPVNYEHSWTHSLALTLLLALTPTIAHAGLEGGAIVGGQGAIVNPNLVIQNSSRLAIDAKGFNVGAGEIFNLQQQSVSDMALIRVLGQSPSDVFGTINAKGQLLISNPNGILFGRDSQVNVGGLIATTLNIDAADFMFSNYNFYKNKRKLGSVVNEGTLTATDGGYIALLAPEARNEGVINARLGTAAIIAGNKVTLNLNEGAMVGYGRYHHNFSRLRSGHCPH